MSEIDIIIPNWNGRQWLGDCLASLTAQTFKDFEIIVVDNGSTDDSVEFVRSTFPGVRLVELAYNTGFAGAINAGVRAGASPFACWFNNDAEAAPDFLAQLLTTLKANADPSFTMAAPRILYYDQPSLINSAGLFVGPDGIGRDRGFKQPDGPPFGGVEEVFGPSGTAALYRRAIFDQIGWLDEDFFLYSEDVDFNYRAQLAGHRCLYVPSAQVRHRVSATARLINRRATRLASGNGLTAILKSWPGPLLLKSLPWLVAGQLYQLSLFARRGQLWPALQGKLDAVSKLKPTLAKRWAIQARRKISPQEFERQIKLGRTRPRVLRGSSK